MTNPHQTSQILTYVGQAAEDLPRDAVRLKIFCPELTPALSGAYAAATQEVTAQTTNRRGVTETSRVTVSNTITATFWGQSNQSVAPRVRKGEQVMVLKYADRDEFYWQPTGRDQHARTTDTFRVEAAAAPATAEARGDDNSYILTVSGEDKQVLIKTSKANGEPFAYTIRIDTAGGTISINDDVGNRVFIDSATPQVQMNNKDGAVVNLFQKNATIAAPEDLVLKAGRQLVVDAPVSTYRTEEGGGTTVINVQRLAIQAAEGITMGAPVVGINAEATKIPGHVVAGPMRSEGYATGDAGAGYPKAEVAVADGQASKPTLSPDTNTGGGDNRHAAAWEETRQALEHIHSCFEEIKAVIGAPASHINLPPLYDPIRMNRLRGD